MKEETVERNQNSACRLFLLYNNTNLEYIQYRFKKYQIITAFGKILLANIKSIDILKVRY